MKKTIILLLFVFHGMTGFSQNENDRFALKLDVSGIFLKALGPTLSNPEITTFETRKWAVPSIDFGYYVKPKIVVGLNLTPSYEIFIEEVWGLSNGPLDGNLDLEYQTPFIFSIYSKYYPFSKGLYGSVALQYLRNTNYEAVLSPINTAIAIGNNLYASEAVMQWNYKSAFTPAFMLGYTYIAKEKYLIDVGLQVPVIRGPYHEDIELLVRNGDISATDREIGVSRIRDEIFYYPVQFRIQFGILL